MRILNRPMFRYGGPIKEGLMHGMKNGGSMRENQGKYLVGDPIYPKTDGRAHHAIFGGAGIAAALAAAARYGKPLFQAGKRLFGKTTPGGVQTFSGPQRTWNIGKGFSSTPGYTKDLGAATFNPNWLGRDPLVQSVGWAGKALTNPAAKGFGKGVVRFAGAPSTLIGGLWFANGRWFNKKGDELDPNAPEVTKAIAKAGGPPGGGDKGMMGTGEWFEAKAQKKLAAKNKADRKAKLEKYLDTMGYDKAKKTAMGDALIDASAIVQQGTEEGGSLKHADWGKMINKAIQTTSKRLDKPEQIREAVGLMLTKSEIEKDLEDPQTKELRRLQIKGAEKTLAGETLQESINAAYQRTGKFPTGSTLAGVARTKGIEVTSVIPTTDIPDDMSAIDYISIVTEKAKRDGNPMRKGHYVIKDRLVEIDENGDIIKQLI